MKIKSIHGVLAALLLTVGFSGCSQKITCVAPDNSEIRVDVLENGVNPKIVTNRWNPFSGAWYSAHPRTVSDGVIVASRTTPGLSEVFGAQRIELNGNENTVRVGENSFKCNGNVSELTTLIEEINRQKFQDRVRKVSSDRFY